MNKALHTLCLSFLLILLICLPLCLIAKPSLHNSSQKKLSDIQIKISKLQTRQTNEAHKRDALQNELKLIDKSIAKITIEIERAETKISTLQNQIQHLENEQKPLQKQFDKASQELSHSLIFSMQLSKADPLFLIANKKDPTLTKRLITYLSYIKAHQMTLLKKVTLFNQALKEKKATIKLSIQTLNAIQSEQTQRLMLYNEDKDLQRDIIHVISKQIKNRSKRLYALKKNEKQLITIIHSIKQKQLQKTDLQPFYTLRKRLPWPMKRKYKGRKFNVRELIRGNGIFIPASEGRQIHAVRTGKVVFSDWLRGYGLLVILQHDNGFMTLYANNQALYKDKGGTAFTGEKIATVGHSGGQLDDGLYFEIRRNGRPQSPQNWLQ